MKNIGSEKERDARGRHAGRRRLGCEGWTIREMMGVGVFLA